jgi:hypothetical protein
MCWVNISYQDSVNTGYQLTLSGDFAHPMKAVDCVERSH